MFNFFKIFPNLYKLPWITVTIPHICLLTNVRYKTYYVVGWIWIKGWKIPFVWHIYAFINLQKKKKQQTETCFIFFFCIVYFVVFNTVLSVASTCFVEYRPILALLIYWKEIFSSSFKIPRRYFLVFWVKKNTRNEIHK